MDHEVRSFTFLKKCCRPPVTQNNNKHNHKYKHNINCNPARSTDVKMFGHSYVEGDSYEDKFAEIEAMGGDPFFLDFDENDGDDDNKTVGDDPDEEEDYSPTAGRGPRPDRKEEVDVEEWDGWEIEDAHFDD